MNTNEYVPPSFPVTVNLRAAITGYIDAVGRTLEVSVGFRYLNVEVIAERSRIVDALRWDYSAPFIRPSSKEGLATEQVIHKAMCDAIYDWVESEHPGYGDRIADISALTLKHLRSAPQQILRLPEPP